MPRPSVAAFICIRISAAAMAIASILTARPRSPSTASLYVRARSLDWGKLRCSPPCWTLTKCNSIEIGYAVCRCRPMAPRDTRGSKWLFHCPWMKTWSCWLRAAKPLNGNIWPAWKKSRKYFISRKNFLVMKCLILFYKICDKILKYISCKIFDNWEIESKWFEK